MEKENERSTFIKLEINHADIVPKGRGGIMYGEIQSQIQNKSVIHM